MTQAPAKTREQEDAGQCRAAEAMGIVYVPQLREDRPNAAEPICWSTVMPCWRLEPMMVTVW